MNAFAIPAAPGTYLLVLRADAPARVGVGSLGELEVRPGYYLYAGSALGPGGLRARLSRHIAGQGALRWHIDYLRRAVQPVEAWCAAGPLRREHEWAVSLAAAGECRIALARFGASDCRCPAHLFYLPHRPDPAWLRASLEQSSSIGEIQVFAALD